MKRVLGKFMILVMVFSLVFSATLPVAAATKTKTINLKKKTTTVSASITVGDKLKLTVKQDKKKVSLSKATFKSSKKAVATVSKKGVITAKKAGTATITIKANKRTVKLKVTVKKKSNSTIKTKTINLKKKATTVSTKMTAGKKLKLIVKQDKKKVSLSKVTFKSSKKAVASVTKKGVITAKKAGTATITIKANKRTVKLKVTVKKQEESEPIPTPTPTPDPEPVEPNREPITQPFMSTYDGQQRPITFKWSVEDLDYTASNEKPNKHLTIAALALATNIETTLGSSQWDLVYNTLDKMGFTENKYHAYFNYDEKPQEINCPAMVFATHKDKVNGKNVVVAVFRGSSSVQDFITDIKSQISLSLITILASAQDPSKLQELIERYLNPDTDSDNPEKVLGFYEVGVNATAELKAYLDKNGFSKDNTTVFITGHSLGAATASLVGLHTAAELVNPDSVFCYPFATPNYFKGVEPSLSSKRMTGKGMKMFSFDNEEDIVPDVPLGLSYYKTMNRVNLDREWIEVNEPERYALFNELYSYFRGRSYEEDNGNFMPTEYSFALFSDLGIQVDSIMVRNHMPYTYMALILSALPAEEARTYIK